MKHLIHIFIKRKAVKQCLMPFDIGDLQQYISGAIQK